MTDVLKQALAKAAQNSSSMVQAGTKASYDNPKHQNQLKCGGKVYAKPMAKGGKVHKDEAEDKKLIAKEFKSRGLKSGGPLKKQKAPLK